MRVLAASLFALFAVVFAGVRVAPFVASHPSSTVKKGLPLGILPSTDPVAEYPAGSQIPTGKNIPSESHFCEIYKSWAKRALLERYKQLHPADDKVPRFLEESFGYLLLNLSQEAQNRFNAHAITLEPMAKSDPAFCLLAGLLRIDPEQKEQLLQKAIEGFQGSRYAPFLLFMAAANLSQSLADRGAGPALIEKSDRLALAVLDKSFGRDSFEDNELSALRWRLSAGSSTGLFHRRGAEAAEIVEKITDLTPWIKEFALGRIYEGAAWAARSDGWGDEVTPEGAVGFQKNLELAAEHFTASWELNPKDPGAAACMITVMMGASGDKAAMRQWFDRAVAAQVDFQDAYNAFGWALRPRWHGSHAEMLLFADECIRSDRFDTFVPSYYFKLVEEIASEEPDHEAIYKRPEIYRNLQYVLERYLEMPEMPFAPSYAHTLAAIFDYKNGNLAGAKRHLAAIHFQPNKSSTLALLEDIPTMLKRVSDL
jgi:hypothetical protein